MLFHSHLHERFKPSVHNSIHIITVYLRNFVIVYESQNAQDTPPKAFFPTLYIITKTYDPKLGSSSKSQALMNKSFHCIV